MNAMIWRNKTLAHCVLLLTRYTDMHNDTGSLLNGVLVLINSHKPWACTFKSHCIYRILPRTVLKVGSHYPFFYTEYNRKISRSSNPVSLPSRTNFHVTIIILTRWFRSGWCIVCLYKYFSWNDISIHYIYFKQTR